MDNAQTVSERSPRRWPAIGLAVVLIGAALGFTRPWQREGDSAYGIVEQVRPASAEAADLETSPTIGQLAPNFLLQTFDGQTLRLSDVRGKPVFINFWATWCVFCVSEMPAIQRLADRYEGQLVVVGINVGQATEEAQGFIQSSGIRYPLLLDRETNVTEAYQVRSMPTSLLVDAEGVVRFVNYGVLTSAQMEEIVQPLLVASDAAA